MVYKTGEVKHAPVMKKYYLETHGCQMNAHDSEKASFALSESGYELTHDPSEADLVLLNTCMVREKPEQKVFRRIQELRKKIGSVNRNDNHVLVGVMGCVAQAEGERIFDRSSMVNFVVGTQSISKIPQLLNRLGQGEEKVLDVSLSRDAEFFNIEISGRQSQFAGYISIIEGCNKFCSFCIVPFTRGRERSRSAESILEEVQKLNSSGYQEIYLLGQNVNSYGLSGRLRGNSHSGKGSGNEGTFADLLALLARESGIPRIKFTTSHPRDFDEEIIRTIDQHENLCEWIHLPVQSGSDRVLRMMRRGYSGAEYLRKIESIKSGQKDYAITGDVIVGFPGEMESDFRDTLSMVSEVAYDGLYIFKYSPRPGTPAAAFSDSVPDEVKTERFLRLQELQGRVQQMRYQRLVGKVMEVLVEKVSARSEEQLAGHTRCNKVVNFPASVEDQEKLMGRLVNVRITDAARNSLKGVLV
jgi:tRNA-2-methylthio-N6-dimethylallyladenosine synthase